MADIPTDLKKIRARLRSYERKLRKEKERFGSYGDGAGKRYFVGPLYMLLGDLEGALKSFAWYAREFPDDIGEAGHFLCWSVALHRSGEQEDAAAKLRCAMFANRFAVPKLIGVAPDDVGIVGDSDGLEMMYLEDIPEVYFGLWSDAERGWASEFFHSAVWSALRARYFKIEKILSNEARGPRRSALVSEKGAIERGEV